MPATLDRPKRSQDELKLHMSGASFMRKAWPDDLLWFYVPNGEEKDDEAIRKLLAMGMLPGLTDILVVLPNAQLGAIEFKDDDGQLSDAQIEVRDKLLALKVPYRICRSIPQLKETTTRWLAAFGRTLKAYAPYQPRYVSARFG